MIVKTDEVTTKAHVGCKLCGLHMWVEVDAKFIYHDNGAKTYEFTATAQVAWWYNAHRNPYVIEFSKV